MSARRSLPLLRDALLVAGLAVLTVQALRRFVGDRYLVPSGSMEPLLHGHPQHGDIVFVDKTASSSAQRRHDLVVVAHPTEPGQQMVKRLAACGDDDDACWIKLAEGDVWLGPDAQHLQREQKDPLLARGQRVPWAAVPGTAASDGAIDLGAAVAIGGGAANGAWRLPASESSLADRRQQQRPAERFARRRAGERVLPPGCIGTARAVDAGWVDVTGARSQVGSDVLVTDVGLELDVRALRGELLATIETRAEALTFHWQPASGRLVLWCDGVDHSTATLPPSPAPVRVEFGLLDHRVFFVVDGDPQRSCVVEQPERRAGGGEPETGPLRGPRTLAYVAVVTGERDSAAAGLEFTALRVFHDVFAWADKIVGMPGQPNWPRFVPPGHWFLLGDSAFDSRDSRQFGPVPASSFLGVPRAVLGPWARRRWVRP
jgi:hypothetical protein